MLSRSDAERVILRALSLSKADETIVNVDGGISSLTRFSENRIHQNVSEERYHLAVRARLGGRMGRATTNQLDEEAIRRVVEQAEAVARLMPEDPEMLPIPGPQAYPEVSNYDRATAEMSPEDRAGRVGIAIELCRQNGLRGAGNYATGDSGTVAIGASTGLFGYYRASQAQFGVIVLSDDSEGGASGGAAMADGVDVENLTRQAIERALLGRNPVGVEPGEYTVILGPRAFGTFLGFLTREMDAGQVEEGLSPLKGMVGEKAFDEKVTIRSRPGGRPFDADGLSGRPVNLVEKGVVRELFVSRALAAKRGIEPTGSGGGTTVEGGDRSLGGLIASTERGILITECHYTKCTDPATVTINGMTRNGTFLIEDGRITKGLKNLRFNQSVLDTFREGIEEIGRAEKGLPPVKVRNFGIASVAEG